MQEHLRKGVHVLNVPSQMNRILELWQSNRTGFQDVQPEIQEPSSPSAVSLNQQKEVHASQGSATKNPPPKGSGFWGKAIPQGLEPRTVCLEGRCSILLSYGTQTRCAHQRSSCKDVTEHARFPNSGTQKKGRRIGQPFSFSSCAGINCP